MKLYVWKSHVGSIVSESIFMGCRPLFAPQMWPLYPECDVIPVFNIVPMNHPTRKISWEQKDRWTDRKWSIGAHHALTDLRTPLFYCSISALGHWNLSGCMFKSNQIKSNNFFSLNSFMFNTGGTGSQLKISVATQLWSGQLAQMRSKDAYSTYLADHHAHIHSISQLVVGLLYRHCIYFLCKLFSSLSKNCRLFW